MHPSTTATKTKRHKIIGWATVSAGEEIHLHTIDRDGDEHMQCENSMENKKKT